MTVSGTVTLPLDMEVTVAAGILGVSALVTVKRDGVVVQNGLLSGLVSLVGSLLGLELSLGAGVVVLNTYTLVIP